MTARTELGPAGRPFSEPVVFGESTYETTPSAVDRGFVVLVFLALAGLALAVGLFVATGNPGIAVAAAAALPSLALLVRYPFIAVLLYLLGTPFFIETESVTPHPAFWLLHRLMVPSMLGLVLVYHAIGVLRFRLKPSIVDVAILAFLGLGVANILLLSDNPTRMLMAFYDRLVVPILLFWLIRALSPGQRDLERLAFAGAIVLLFQATIGLLSWVSPGVLPPAWLGRAGERTVGTFGGPGPYTATLVFFAVLAVHYALAGSGRRPRALLLAIVGLGLFGIFLSFQRGGWLGAVLAFAILWFVHRGATSKLAVAIAIVAGALALGPLASEFQYASERLGDADTVDSRLVTFDAAIQMVQDEPLRGFGYGQFEKFDEQYKRAVGDVAFEEGGSLHNSWLGLAAENGIPAVLLYVLPAIVLAVRSFQRRHTLARRSFLGVGLVVVAWAGVIDVFVVSNTMDMLHSGTWGTTLAWIGLALVAVQLEQAPERAERTRSTIMSRPIRGGATRPGLAR